MDAMSVAIHIKYLVGQNAHITFYWHMKLHSKQPVKQAAL